MSSEMKQGQVELFGWHLDSYLFVWKVEEEKIGPTAKQYIEVASNLNGGVLERIKNCWNTFITFPRFRAYVCNVRK